MGLLHLLVWQEGFEMLRGRKLLWGGICGLEGMKNAGNAFGSKHSGRIFVGFES